MNRSLLLLSMLTATGCTSGKGGFLSGFVPSVEFERLEVIDIDFEHVETDFVFNIDNPNPVGFRIDSFNYALSFADVEFITGDNPDGLVLNPDNDSEATLPTNIVFLDIYDMVQAARGDDHIGFGVEGDFGIRLSSDTVILEEEDGGDTAEGQAGSSSITEDEDGYVVNLPYDAGGDFPALRKPNLSFRKIKVTDLTLDSLNFALKFDVDNEHASNLTFTRFAYDLSLGGGEAISGVVDNLEEIISGSETDDEINPSSVENKILSIPIEINNLEVVTSLGALLLNNDKLDIQFGAATDVDTPFGLVELSIDEQGEIDVEVN
jgi:LEA14-like dessication related protein